MTNRPKSPTMQDGEIQAATAAQTKSCGFCGKSDQEVEVLIQASVGYICDACVAICASIIERDRTAAPVEQQTFKNTKEAMLYAQRNNIPAVVPVGQSEVPALDCLVHGHEWKQEGSKHFCTHCGTGVDVGPFASPARAAAEEWYTTSATHFEDEQDAIDALAAIIERHCFSAPLDSQDGQC